MKENKELSNPNLHMDYGNSSIELASLFLIHHIWNCLSFALCQIASKARHFHTTAFLFDHSQMFVGEFRLMLFSHLKNIAELSLLLRLVVLNKISLSYCLFILLYFMLWLTIRAFAGFQPLILDVRLVTIILRGKAASHWFFFIIYYYNTILIISIQLCSLHPSSKPISSTSSSKSL